MCGTRVVLVSSLGSHPPFFLFFLFALLLLCCSFCVFVFLLTQLHVGPAMQKLSRGGSVASGVGVGVGQAFMCTVMSRDLRAAEGPGEYVSL